MDLYFCNNDICDFKIRMFNADATEIEMCGKIGIDVLESFFMIKG